MYMKRILLLSFLMLCSGMVYAAPGFSYDYQLYKNREDFGIVVFPKDQITTELDQYIKSIIFEPVESGKAEMRSGTKGENETFMMPLEVQKKHAIEKFIVIQMLTDSRLMIGVYDPEWGLTLPSSVYGMDDVKQNIPKTLNVFRGTNPQKPIRFEMRSLHQPEGWGEIVANVRFAHEPPRIRTFSVQPPPAKLRTRKVTEVFPKDPFFNIRSEGICCYAGL